MKMTSEQSKPVALDERDVHFFYRMFGRYEPAVALGIIVILSVWGWLMILHRNVRGQRRKKDENATETEVRAVEETTTDQRLCPAVSTENLMEEVSKAQGEGIGERDGDASLTHDPGLCDGALSELSWPAIGEHQPNAVPGCLDNVAECLDIPQEHKGNHATVLDTQSVLADHKKHVGLLRLEEDQKDQTKNEESFHDCRIDQEQMRYRKDHLSETPKSQELNVEEESNLHQHICDNMESLPDHSDRNIETEENGEFLYANLNSQQEPTSEKTSLSVTEEAIKKSNDYFDVNQQCSSQQDDLTNSEGNCFVTQKEIHGQDSNSNHQQEETCTITEINATETTMKSHQEILTDYQHLREHCEHPSNFHHHGFLTSLLEPENDHLQPSSGPSQVDVIDAISEDKMKTLRCSVTQPPEDNYEKTEINIMEATMDYNEWMNGGSAEMSKLIRSSGKVMYGKAGLENIAIAEQSPQKSADRNQAKLSLTQESGTTLTLFDEDPAIQRIADVQLKPQTVAVSFRVHYITHSPLQLLAVTGNQRELGDWEKFVPLREAKDGFWVNSVTFATDCHVEWKFVVVEDGRIQRWEECNNRHLQTGHEEVIHLHKWWGCV